MAGRTWWLVALLAACSPPEMLDDVTVAEAVPRLFTDFEGEAETLARLVGSLEAALTAADVPLEGPKEARVFVLPEPLWHHTLGGRAEAPEGTAPEAQVHVTLFKRGVTPFDHVVDVALEPNQVCLEGDSTLYHRRTYLTDEACFRQGTCDTLRSTAEVRKELWALDLMIAGVWYDFEKDFRRVLLPDGRRALVARGWQTHNLVGDKGGRFGQYFTAEAWIEQAEGTVRVAATWAEIHVSVVSRAFLEELLGNNLEQTFDRGDSADLVNWDGCSEDRERVDDRPRLP